MRSSGQCSTTSPSTSLCHQVYHINEFPELAAVVHSGDLARVNDGAFATSIELIVADIERLLSKNADSPADR